MTKSPCKHLEALLPQTQLNPISKATIDNAKLLDEVTTSIDEFEDNCKVLHEKLVKQYKLNKTIAHLVIDRFVSGLTIKELADQAGMSSLSIRMALDFAVKQLKDKGVSLGQ